MTRLTRICISLVIVSLMFAGQSHAEVDPETLVGMWLFDEGTGDVAQDSSGNGNDGTLNGPTWTNVSIFGGALEFNGADAYIEFATGENLKTQRLTFMAWFNTRKLDGYGHIFQTGNDWDDMAGYVFRVHQDGYVQSALAFAPGNTATWLSGPSVEADTWYHMVVTYDGTTAMLYLDGENVATGGGQGEIMYDDQPVRIGVLSQTIGSAFDGYIDEVALFDVALEAADIQAIMNDGLLAIIGGYPFASAPNPEDGALHPDVWVSLAWKPGEFAASHNVYMGDNFADVDAGTGGTFLANVPEDNVTKPYLIVGFEGYPFSEGLVPGTTYYWRVDEVNDLHPDSPWKGDVWSFFVPPKKSYEPIPTDGTMFVDPSVTLTWTAGFRSGLQHVYFGDNAADVEAGTGDTYKGPVMSTSYVPDTLDLDKTYYWRVDSTGGTYGDITGDVWSLTTTLPGLGTIIFERWENFTGTLPELKSDPRFPSDPDVTEAVTQFEWNGPDVENYGARIYGWVYAPATGDYTFWLCTDDNGELWLSSDDDSSNAELIAVESSWRDYNSWGSIEERSDPIPLVAGNRYYIEALWQEGTGGDHCQVGWAGPGIAGPTVIAGSYLSPYEPVTAFGPKPGNGAENVTQTPVLEWKPGIQAASHQVYFGTDDDAVRNANTGSLEYKGTRALGDESFDPGKLDWERTYYWRIDEVNNLHADSPWVGAVWSFTTAGFLIVDNMEDYDTVNAIWANWLDGLGYIDTAGVTHAGNGSGSEVGDPSTGSYTEETIVHGGSQSMPYWYNNSGSTGKFNYSEAKLTLSAGKRDWTDGGVKALSLWFQGRPGSVGSFVESPAGTYTMTGSGADITGPADEFHYAYKMLNGQGTIVARVESMENTNDWAKAGVMIRETLEPGSAHAMAFITPTNGAVFEFRPGAGEDNVGAAGQLTGVTAPYWVRLQRDLAGT
ncbi:MAG: PA14 domain-containing protein, partial [Phycisphaerales bacterium]